MREKKDLLTSHRSCFLICPLPTEVHNKAHSAPVREDFRIKHSLLHDINVLLKVYFKEMYSNTIGCSQDSFIMSCFCGLYLLVMLKDVIRTYAEECMKEEKKIQQTQ